MTGPHLDRAVARLLEEARWATLTTLDHTDGRPRSVPICFVVLDGTLYSPLDDKPKTADPLALRRVGNLTADPRATILVHRWDEDWERLAFAELSCTGELAEPDDGVIAALRTKYRQYATHRLEERPMLRFEIQRVTTWSAKP